MAKQTYERKVTKGFTDKNTKKPYPKGSIYKSDDKERINELVKKNNLSGDKVKTLKQAQDKVVSDSLEKSTFEDLKKEVEKKGLNVEGTGKNGAIKKEDYINALKG